MYGFSVPVLLLFLLQLLHQLHNHNDLITGTMEPFPLSSSLRSRYDYYYGLSSPRASVATSFYDNQHASLFGDPVPPPSTSSISDSLNSQLYSSFSRHIDQKMALSYQKADLWSNNKNFYRPRPSTMVDSNRSDSPNTISTIENTVANAAIGSGRATSAMVRRKPPLRK